MKFDYIIQNPPYKKTLHIKFFHKGLDLLAENGRMVIIEPSTWLINVRRNGKAKSEYEPLKARLDGHVSKVVIENYNKEFNVGLYVPCSVTYVDMSREYPEIDLTVCGEHRTALSLFDCNLIGEYGTIWGIFDKVQRYGDMMKDHIYKLGKTKVTEDMWYCKYNELIGYGSGCNIESKAVGGKYTADVFYTKTTKGEQFVSWTNLLYSDYENKISNSVLYRYDRGKHLTDSPADCLYGTREELENWKHFVFNNRLPLFLNMVLTIAQNNNSKDFVPWISGYVYKPKAGKDTYFCKYLEIIGCVGCGSAQEGIRGGGYQYDSAYNLLSFGEYFKGYTKPTFRDIRNIIGNSLLDELYWYCYDVPYISFRRYRDEDIDKIFEFTDEEISLINYTVRKYERKSPWFKRYMCGKDSVSSDEVNEFLQKIRSEEYA